MDGSETTDDVATVAAVELRGTWHLADCRKYYADGRVKRPWGNSASGCLVYAEDGHVCEMLNYPDRSGKIRSSSYCGEYRIVERRIYHTISVSAEVSDIGTTREADLTLDAGRLTLTFSPAPGGGPGSRMEFQWSRASGGRGSGNSTHRALTGNRFNP